MDKLGKEAGEYQVGSIKLHCVLQWESTRDSRLGFEMEEHLDVEFLRMIWGLLRRFNCSFHS